jgi:hypothetical protein
MAGTRQKVDAQLPEDAFKCAQNGADLTGVEKRYQEPIAAMQDLDLEFPEQIKFAYYSLYNLFRRYALRKETDDWVIVNQALSAEIDNGKWAQMLNEAIRLSIANGEKERRI